MAIDPYDTLPPGYMKTATKGFLLGPGVHSRPVKRLAQENDEMKTRLADQDARLRALEEAMQRVSAEGAD